MIKTLKSNIVHRWEGIDFDVRVAISFVFFSYFFLIIAFEKLFEIEGVRSFSTMASFTIIFTYLSFKLKRMVDDIEYTGDNLVVYKLLLIFGVFLSISLSY